MEMRDVDAVALQELKKVKNAASPGAIRILCLHLLGFVLPLTTLGFVLTGPHSAGGSLLWLVPLVVSVIIDNRASADRHQPMATLPGWPFDGVLYLLVAIQLLNIVLLCRMVSIAGFWTMDTLTAFLLVGTNSGYSGIVVAHELIHRPRRHQRLLGRLMLLTVLYEHFYTEHLRGHHTRVGTSDDPATARFGEMYRDFWRRTVPGQFKSAWRLETKRLGDDNMKPWDPRLLRSRVVHGLLAELALSVALVWVFGWAAFSVFLIQAWAGVRLLEAVNYFEHWGLGRSGRQVTSVDSWDSDSWYTLYTLIGLSRHSDHHVHAARSYQQLHHVEQSPKLPRGYLGMVMMVYFRNQRFITLMSEELERKKLGPFADVKGQALQPAS